MKRFYPIAAQVLMFMMTIATTLFFTAMVHAQPYDCSSQAEIPVTECEALVTFYYSTNGDTWRHNDNWLVTTPCDWRGVICESGSVTGLRFIYNDMTGTLPTALADLPNLKELTVNGNDVGGTLPAELGTLTDLEILVLPRNEITGNIPPELGNLTNLTELILWGNKLSGAIPYQLGNLTSLTEFNLSSNLLTGSIPAELGNLLNLTVLGLYHNDLSGTIPPELGNLPNLTHLNLRSNDLTGAIPPELGNLGNLEFLELWNNDLSGNIPVELSNLANLEELILNRNELTGIIPPELGNLSNLETLSLWSNDLSGTIPPSLGNLDSLIVLGLNHNELIGEIPPELGNFAYLTHLSLNNNNLSGTIPHQLGSLSSLKFLNLFINQLTGTIPPELGNLSNLLYLNLYLNNLSGTIPPELGNLSNLTRFLLNRNQLSGSIPPVLGNLSKVNWFSLYSNNLSGTIPPELGNLASVTQLALGDNNLSGEIPPQLSNLSNLRVLGLNDNDLSGEIPPELGNLSYLSNLSLYTNNLSGEIPPELGNLSNLKYLRLNENNLTGSIPQELGNLTVGQFYLQANHLSGLVPLQVAAAGEAASFCYFTNNDCLYMPDTPAYQNLTFDPPGQPICGIVLGAYQPVVMKAGGPYAVDEGDTVPVTATASGGEAPTFSWDLDGDGLFETPGLSGIFSATVLDGPDMRTIAAQGLDGLCPAIIDEANVDVLNVTPAIGSITAPVDPVETGTEIIARADFIDPGIPDTHTCVWDWGDETTSDGTIVEDEPVDLARGTHAYAEAGTYTVRLILTDDDGGSNEALFEYVVVIPAIVNRPPVITEITAPIDPMPVTTEIAVSATFTDPDPDDTHTATWKWGDETTSEGTVTEPVGNDPGTVSGTHTYTTAGVYTLTLTVTDSYDEFDEATYQYLVIYDPDGGFVTGGGWITSPEGACHFEACTNETTGKASFGFVAKYKKGKNTPDGQTQFQFKAADLNFHSDAYDWLVVAGHKAKYKGTGTINQAGNYGFMISAIDEALTPSTDVDLFRMKIWDKDNADAVVYDNQLDADDDADPTTALGGGNIKIHDGKKSSKVASALDLEASTVETLPTEYGLSQNYPNPFNPVTVIRYALPEASRVQLVVYDVLGRVVAVLADGPQQAGRYEVTFDASALGAGVYLYRIEAGDFMATRRLTLLK